MELLKFHITVAPNKARDPTGNFGIQQRFPAKGASVEKAMGGAMSIAINIVKPHRVPTPGVPNHAHEAGPQHRGDGGDTATAHHDGEKAAAIRFGGRQDDLTTSPTDIPQDRAPQSDPGLLDKSNVPTEGRKVGLTLCKTGEIGGDNGRAGVGGRSDAVMALAICAKGAWVPRRNPGYTAVAPKVGVTARQGPIQRAHAGKP